MIRLKDWSTPYHNETKAQENMLWWIYLFEVMSLWVCLQYILVSGILCHCIFPESWKKGFPTADTCFASVCWIAPSWFIYCSSNGSLVMGLFVILISRQSDFIKSFTSLLHISGLDATDISLRLWKRFAKRMFRVHSCIKADGKLVWSSACSAGEPFCSSGV